MNSRYNRWSAVSIFLISIVVIALQLVLMRAISVSHYYHFTYLVISTALLGFGASGTFLALWFDRLKENFPFWNLLFLLLFLISIPATYLGAQAIPLDTQFLLYSGRQVMLLLLYNLLLLIPFLFGGLVITFMLAYFKKEVPQLYGANLIGSGVGGITALVMMSLIPAYQLPMVMAPLALLALLAFVASVGWKSSFRSRSIVIIITAGILGTAFSLLVEAPDRVDPYKPLSHFRQLEEQSDASQTALRFGPRAQIDIFESPTFHYTLFAGPQATVRPPSQLAILMDGQIAAPLFSIDSPDQARVMDYTPQSLPYRLFERPRVLLLGETGGANVWLARRMGAESITVVQGNPQLVALIRDELANYGGDVFSGDDIEIVNRDPRLYLEQSEQKYDLIQFVTGEAVATGTSGLQGLHEDYMLTREAIMTAIGLLSPDGIVSITRGVQTPVRDNLKILSIFIDAAAKSGMEDPGQHLAVSRNYLAVNTLLSASPLSGTRLDTYLQEAGRLQVDLEHYPGIRSEEIDQINRIDGPEGKPWSWIHQASLELLYGDSESFFREWIYDVRPATDNSPYFHDFFKWDSLDRFIEIYGDRWFQHLELGYVVLVVTTLQLAVAAFLLILLPLFLKRYRYRASINKLPTLFHFMMIGTGFMFIEITLIQTFIKFLGDPIFSAAAVICSILVFSGLGSFFQKRIGLPARLRIRYAVGAILFFAVIFLLFSDRLLDLFIAAGTISRFAIAILTLFPISFFLGWMLPSGIDILDRNSDELIPWALAIDSFASVTAAPLAIILSMSIGFSNVILIGAGCYLAAGLTSWLWRSRDFSPSP